MKTRLWLDMDGVLARIHDEENFAERMYEKGFFSGLKPYEEAINAAKALTRNPNIEVNIISSCINSNSVAEKQIWLDKYLPEITPYHRYFPSCGESKSQFLSSWGIKLSKSDLLFDDYNKNLTEWENSGGKAILCINNTSHLRPKGTVWSGLSIANSDSAVKIAEKLSKALQTKTVKFYNKIYPSIRECDKETGVFYTDVWDMSSKYTVKYVDEMNAHLGKEFNASCDEPERGLMKYYHSDESVGVKVRSLFQHFEVIGDDVYYVSQCEVTAELTLEEAELLKEYIAEQNSDGFGVKLEQRPIKIDDGELNIRTWSNKKDFAVMTEYEFATFQNGNLSQTLSDHGIESDEPTFEISM